MARAPRQPRGPGRSGESLNTSAEAVAYLRTVRREAPAEVETLMEAAKAGVEVTQRVREILAVFDQFSPFFKMLARVAKIEIALKLPASPARPHAFDADLEELAAKLRGFQGLLMNARKHLGTLATRFDGERSEIKRLTKPWLVMAGSAMAAAAKAGFRPPRDTELAALAVWTGADSKKGSKAQLGERWRKRRTDVEAVATYIQSIEGASEQPAFVIPTPEKIRQAFARSNSGVRKPEK